MKNKILISCATGEISYEIISFLKKKYLGITEYLAKKTKSRNPVMLIYNDTLSVSPITTHLPIKYVSKNINKSKIINFIKNNFEKKYSFYA